MNPSPFETAQMISNRFGNVQQRQNDLSAIDQILSGASSTGNPQDLDTAMNQILSRVSPERQQSALAILQNRQKQISEGQARQQKMQAEQQAKQQQAQADQQAGIPDYVRNLSTEAQKDYFKSRQPKNQQDLKEKRAPYESAKSTLDRMREIRKGGNLGFRYGVRNWSPQSRKDNAEYERLGKSLIALSSTIPIRNRQEFETLSADLYDPKTTDATADGILTAMEKIISDGIKQYSEDGSQENTSSMQPGESVATELKASNFWR